MNTTGKIQFKTEISLEEFYEMIAQMQLEQKIILFKKLQQELLSEAEELPTWHQTILVERLAKYQQNPTQTVNWEDLEKNLSEKYGL